MLISEATDAFCKQLDEALADMKLTAQESYDLVRGPAFALHQAIRANGGDSAERKAEWVAAAQKIYDQSLAPIDIPSVNNMIERFFVDPYGRKALSWLVGVLFNLVEDGVDWAYDLIERGFLEFFKAAKGE